MKKVITGEMPKLIGINDLTDRDYVGMEFESGEKCKIFKVQEGVYSALPLDTPVGEYSGLIIGQNIQELVFKVSGSQAPKLFVFDSPAEQALWLIERL